jgi:hypothetical protein
MYYIKHNLEEDYKNIINSQNKKLINLYDELFKLKREKVVEFFKYVVLSELKYKYQIKKIQIEYRKLLKQILLEQINNRNKNSKYKTTQNINMLNRNDDNFIII